MAGKPVLLLLVFMILQPYFKEALVLFDLTNTKGYQRLSTPGGNVAPEVKDSGVEAESSEWGAEYSDGSGSPNDFFTTTFPRPWEYGNLSFTETLVSWESLACGGSSSFCGSSRDNPYFKEPGKLTCDNCLCDSCNIYGDCCLDWYLKRNVEDDRLDSLECLSGTEGWESAVTPMAQPYYFVSRCPEKYLNIGTREACEDRKDQLQEALRDPPVYNPVSRLSYINSYCAKCHESSEMTQLWTPNVVCTDSQILQTIKSMGDLLQLVKEGSACHVSFSAPPFASVRECQRVGLIVECNVTGTWQEYDPMLQEACGTYTHVVHVHGQRYRNIFCAMCNGVIKRSPTGLLENYNFCDKHESVAEGRIANVVVPFSRIFDLSPDTSLPTSDKTECPGNSVFDTLKDECRKLLCSKGRTPINHSCVGALPTAKGEAYRLLFDISPEKRNCKPDEIWQTFQEVMKRLSSTLYPCYQRLVMYEYNLTEQSSAVTTTWLEYNVIVGKFISQEEAEFHLLDSLNSSWFAHGPPGRSHYTVLSGNASTEVIRYTLKTESCDGPLNETSIITLHKLSRCNQIELEDSEFSMNSSTSVITLKPSGDELGVSEYLVVKDKIRICVNFSGWYQSETKGSVDETEYWLTLISLVVSLSALFLTFLLSLCSKSRNTVPGLITIMLVVTIFLAQGIFLFLPLASSNKWTCQIIGLLTHYSWLVVFAWKNVAAFHMYVAFTQPFASRSTSPQRALLKYALYAFGAPAVLVISYVVAQGELLNHERFGYTHDCFLAAPVDLGLAFVAPVSLVLLINGYFFTRVVHVLKKMSEFEKNSNQSNSSHTALFIKMSLILGFMWAAGFLGNMLDVKALWYVFDALNGGVGLLILVIQLSNKQFLHRTKKALRLRGKLTATTTTETTENF